MFFLNFTFKKYHRFFKPKYFCLFIAFNQAYTTFVFHYLSVEEYCFPPNLYVALEYLTFAVAAVSVVTGIMLWVALLSKKFKPKLFMGFLLVQHISILYGCVTGLLLYGTDYTDEDHCYLDVFFLGLSILLVMCYNVTILAYGQTGSGNTYTMGTNYSGSDGDSTKLGVIPQAVADIFEFIETHEDDFIFKVTVSYMELYQEQCVDLLSGKERRHSILEIREDGNKGVILQGISDIPVSSKMETMMVLERGSAGRVTGSTAMKEASSRSHAVFAIVIYKESRADKNMATTSKFQLVDLAGSERIKKTKASGERLKEGVKINQGLLALGNVISALGDGTNRSFIGYRDSKLTRLLQD